MNRYYTTWSYKGVLYAKGWENHPKEGVQWYEGEIDDAFGDNIRDCKLISKKAFDATYTVKKEVSTRHLGLFYIVTKWKYAKTASAKKVVKRKKTTTTNKMSYKKTTYRKKSGTGKVPARIYNKLSARSKSEIKKVIAGKPIRKTKRKTRSKGLLGLGFFGL